MLVGTINKEYERAAKRAQKLFIDYVVRFIDRWYPASLGEMRCEWKRGNKAYFMSVKIKEISDDLQ